MGKKIKAPVKAITNAAKNFTMVGHTNAGIKKLTGIDALGTAQDLITGKSGGSPGPVLDPNAFDLSKQSAEYEKLAQEARIRNLQNNQSFTEQLQKQSRGEGPSLATAQLKSAQNRNLAQTLSAAQATNASPLATRQLLQGRGQASRDLAELGGMQRMQEQQAAQQMLGQQLGQEANIARGDIAQGFDIARAPIDTQMQYETNRFAADVARRNAVKQQQSQILGGLIGAGGTIGGAMLSDERQKKAPKKKSNFADAVSRYSPSNTEDAISGAGDMIAGVIKDNKAEKAAQRNPSTKPMQRLSQDLVSDERQKQKPGLPSAKKEVGDFLDKLSARQYEYKDPTLPGAAEGTRVGITAQDLERSTLGKSLVKDTEQGKMVDTVQGFGAVLAAQSELNRRLKKLEKKG